MIDYYAILQVAPSATRDVIAHAYKKLAFQYHPDMNPSPDATEKMRQINEAYEVLGDPDKRARYDLARTQPYNPTPNSQMPRSPYGSPNGGRSGPGYYPPPRGYSTPPRGYTTPPRGYGAPPPYGYSNPPPRRTRYTRYGSSTPGRGWSWQAILIGFAILSGLLRMGSLNLPNLSSPGFTQGAPSINGVPLASLPNLSAPPAATDLPFPVTETIPMAMRPCTGGAYPYVYQDGNFVRTGIPVSSRSTVEVYGTSGRFSFVGVDDGGTPYYFRQADLCGASSSSTSMAEGVGSLSVGVS